VQLLHTFFIYLACTFILVLLYLNILSEDCVYIMHMKLIVIKCFKSNFIVNRVVNVFVPL